MKPRIKTIRINGKFIPVTTRVCGGIFKEIKSGVNTKDALRARREQEQREIARV